MVSPHDSRSYVVKTADGAAYRRNRRHLIQTNEKPCTDPESNISYFQPSSETCTESETTPVKPTNNTDHSSSEPIYVPNNSHGNNIPYVTRSGRVVKKKVIKSV